MAAKRSCCPDLEPVLNNAQYRPQPLLTAIFRQRMRKSLVMSWFSSLLVRVIRSRSHWTRRKKRSKLGWKNDFKIPLQHQHGPHYTHQATRASEWDLAPLLRAARLVWMGLHLILDIFRVRYNGAKCVLRCIFFSQWRRTIVTRVWIRKKRPLRKMQEFFALVSAPIPALCVHWSSVKPETHLA